MKQKKLRILGSLLLILTLITPYFYINIDAAAKFTLKNGKTVSSILYANHPYTLKVGSQKVYYYTSNRSILTVNKTSGKLLVKEPGMVTITAKSRYTGRTICKRTFTVKRRSDYIYSNTKTLTMVTGDTKKLSIRKSPSNSTDVLRFKSNNPKIATINSVNGTVTAVGAGTTNIIVYSKATASTANSSSSNKTLKIKVKVYSGVTSAKQIELNQIEVKFSSKPTTITASEISLISSTGRKVTASNITIDDKTAIVTLNQNLTDGKVYTLSYRSSSCNFTASDGVIKKFEISPVKIPVNRETAVTAQAYDKNGILLGEYTYGNTYSNITFTVTSGYLTSKKQLNFTSASGIATARIIYKKTVNGISTTIADSGSVTISAYDPELVSAKFYCNITNNPAFSFTNSTTNRLMVPNESTDYRAFIKIVNSSDKEISNYAGYSIESANTSILTVYENQLDNSHKYALLLPIQTGRTYLYLKDKNNSVIYSFPVTVSTKSTLSVLSVSKNSVNLTNLQNSTTQAVTVSCSDQYGNSMMDYLATNYTFECTNTTAFGIDANYVNSLNSEFYNINFPTITFKGYQLPPGRYTYKLTSGTRAIYIYVTISGVAVSISPSPSVSPTPSATVTLSPSASVTATPIVTVTPVTSQVPSASPSTSPSPSPSPSASATPSTSTQPSASDTASTTSNT